MKDKNSLVLALQRRHRRLDLQVRLLSRRIGLSSREQAFVKELKKRRLWTRDRIAGLSVG